MNSEQNQGGFGRIVNDVFDLCELQLQLLSVDSQEAKRRGVKAAICIGIAANISLAAVVTALVGLGFVLHEQAELSIGQSLLIVSGTSVVISGIAMLIGAKMLAKANDSLTSVKREFAENMRWIKAVVLKPNQSPRNQIRRESFSPSPASR